MISLLCCRLLDDISCFGHSTALINRNVIMINKTFTETFDNNVQIKAGFDLFVYHHYIYSPTTCPSWPIQHCNARRIHTCMYITQLYVYAICTSYKKYMHNVNMYLKSITHFTAFAFCNVRAEIVN